VLSKHACVAIVIRRKGNDEDGIDDPKIELAS
jgi:hypothetical protein